MNLSQVCFFPRVLLSCCPRVLFNTFCVQLRIAHSGEKQLPGTILKSVVTGDVFKRWRASLRFAWKEDDNVACIKKTLDRKAGFINALSHGLRTSRRAECLQGELMDVVCNAPCVSNFFSFLCSEAIAFSWLIAL